MVSATLAKRGNEAHAIDQRADGFDERAKNAGVQFHQTSATHIPYPDNAFDFVFSYDTFEHLQNPTESLIEMIRIMKPGGIFFAYFGPLAMSARGLHAYKTIGIPYVQHLFPREHIDAYLQAHHRTPIDYDQLNFERRATFEKMFHETPGIELLSYREEPHFAGKKIIEQYPSCLKSKSDDLRDFLIANIEAVFRKK